MKVLLKTLCGCTKLIDVPQADGILKIPLYTKFKAYNDYYGLETEIKTRTFRLDTKETWSIDQTPLLVYLEEERNTVK